MPHQNDPLISRTQLERAVREILAEMLGVQAEPRVVHNRQWYSADEAYRLLDLDSAEKLHKKRRSGLLREGVHCRTDNDSPNAKVPRWQYHVERCREELAKDAAKRRQR